MGAVIFAKLEGENEILTRVRVGNNRKEILEQLYNITGACSTEYFTVWQILWGSRNSILFRQMNETTPQLISCFVSVSILVSWPFKARPLALHRTTSSQRSATRHISCRTNSGNFSGELTEECISCMMNFNFLKFKTTRSLFEFSRVKLRN